MINSPLARVLLRKIRNNGTEESNSCKISKCPNIPKQTTGLPFAKWGGLQERKIVPNTICAVRKRLSPAIS